MARHQHGPRSPPTIGGNGALGAIADNRTGIVHQGQPRRVLGRPLCSLPSMSTLCRLLPTKSNAVELRYHILHHRKSHWDRPLSPSQPQLPCPIQVGRQIAIRSIAIERSRSAGMLFYPGRATTVHVSGGNPTQESSFRLICNSSLLLRGGGWSITHPIAGIQSARGTERKVTGEIDLHANFVCLVWTANAGAKPLFPTGMHCGGDRSVVLAMDTRTVKMPASPIHLFSYIRLLVLFLGPRPPTNGI